MQAKSIRGELAGRVIEAFQYEGNRWGPTRDISRDNDHVQGRVLIARSPCMAPWDVQKVRAFGQAEVVDRFGRPRARDAGRRSGPRSDRSQSLSQAQYLR
jgi:hypothetical protein